MLDAVAARDPETRADVAPAPSSTPRRPATGTVVAGVVVGALTLVNAAWLLANRAHGPLDIDEAGYLAQATAATADIQAGAVIHGPGALWGGSATGPLLPVLTVPAQLVLGRTAMAGLLANLAFFVVLGVSTYVLGRRWLDRRWAVLALVVTLTAPGITAFSRHYVFALAGTATFTLALTALVRSARLTHRRWAVTFGVAVGLTVLSRTIMIAFLPGLALAGVVAWWQSPRERRRQELPNLVLAGGAAVLVAASWYVFSARAVLDYLLDFGYGSASEDYGVVSMRTAQYWLSDLADVVRHDLYVPLTIVLGVGSALGAWSWWRAARPAALGRAVRSDAFVVALPIALAMAALLTSRNTGYGFTLPLVPGAVVLATVLTSKIATDGARTAVAGVLALVAAVNVAMTSSLLPALAEHRVAWSNDWTELTITDGRSNIARYVAAETAYPLEADGTVPAMHEDWLDAARTTRDELRAAEAAPGATRSVIAVDGPMYNLNLLALAGELDAEPALRLTAFDPGTAPPTVDTVAAALTDARSQGATTLVTGPDSLAWHGTVLPLDAVEAGATEAGFTRAGQVTLPDGQVVTIWAARPDRASP